MKMYALAAVAATLVATPAFAATTDTTTFGADIAAVCTIDGPNSTSGLDLNDTGLQPLGNVVIQCNDPQGFTASATSSNLGKLAAAHGGSQTTYDYVLNVAGVGDRSLATAQSINTGTAYAAYALTPQPVAVGVKITGPNGAPFAGDYRDTITWSITAN